MATKQPQTHWSGVSIDGLPFPNMNSFGVEGANNFFQAITRDHGGNGGGLSLLALLYGGINDQKGHFLWLESYRRSTPVDFEP